MKLQHIIALALAFIFSFTIHSKEYPWLSKLDYENDVFKSGKELMKLEYGLHSLEEKPVNEGSMIIAVHGSRSQGYEWIYPLKSIDSKTNDIYFFRWNDQGCPKPSAILLNELITEYVSINSGIERVILISHSYGGLLTAWFYENWSKNIPMEIHTIATPIAGMVTVNQLCGYNPPEKINKNVKVNQWITQKNIDNAFKELEVDPQIISLEKNIIYLLPDRYKNRRLGHNWSISYVIDEIIKTHKEMKK